MDEPKIVLFNDLTACRQKSGVGCYASQLLRHLDGNDGDFRVVPLSQTFAGAPLRAASRFYDRARSQTAAASSGGGGDRPDSLRRSLLRLVRKRGHAALDLYLRAAAKLGRWQIYHEPDAVPLAINAPTVSTVHDLSVLLFPHWHPKHRVEKYERHLRAGLERTAQFVAVSEATRQDMIAHLGLPAERIHVIPEAPRPEFRSLPTDEVQAACKRLGLPERFLLYVGTIEPRKNVAGLLRAFGRLPASVRSACPLVLAGGWGWKSEPVRQLLDTAPWAGDVLRVGYIEDDQLVAVMNAATALVYPSFYEGFGLPPLEAMACGTPVITTHAGSLKEVIGDAAIIVEPEDEDDLSLALKAVIVHPEVGEEYRARGWHHVQKFTWSAAADATKEVYRKAA